MKPVSKIQKIGVFLLKVFNSLAILKAAPGLSWDKILTGRRLPVAMVITWLVEA